MGRFQLGGLWATLFVRIHLFNLLSEHVALRELPASRPRGPTPQTPARSRSVARCAHGCAPCANGGEAGRARGSRPSPARPACTVSGYTRSLAGPAPLALLLEPDEAPPGPGTTSGRSSQPSRFSASAPKTARALSPGSTLRPLTTLEAEQVPLRTRPPGASKSPEKAALVQGRQVPGPGGGHKGRSRPLGDALSGHRCWAARLGGAGGPGGLRRVSIVT